MYFCAVLVWYSLPVFAPGGTGAAAGKADVGRRRAAGVVAGPPDHIRRQKSSQEKQDARKKSV